MDLGVMERRHDSTFPKAPEDEPHYCVLFFLKKNFILFFKGYNQRFLSELLLDFV